MLEILFVHNVKHGGLMSTTSTCKQYYKFKAIFGDAYYCVHDKQHLYRYSTLFNTWYALPSIQTSSILWAITDCGQPITRLDLAIAGIPECIGVTEIRSWTSINEDIINGV